MKVEVTPPPYIIVPSNGKITIGIHVTAIKYTPSISALRVVLVGGVKVLTINLPDVGVATEATDTLWKNVNAPTDDIACALESVGDGETANVEAGDAVVINGGKIVVDGIEYVPASPVVMTKAGTVVGPAYICRQPQNIETTTAKLRFQAIDNNGNVVQTKDVNLQVAAKEYKFHDNVEVYASVW